MSRSDRRFADVIEHEADLGATTHQLDGVGQLKMLHADIETEVVLGEQLHAFDEARLQAEIDVRFELDQPADRLHVFHCRKLGQCAFYPSTFLQCHGRNDAPQLRNRFEQSGDPLRLGHLMRLIDPDLHEYDLIDGGLADGGTKIGRQMGPVELRDVVHPRIGEPARVVEMNVSVNDRNAYHPSLPVAVLLRRLAQPGSRSSLPTVSSVPAGRCGYYVGTAAGAPPRTVGRLSGQSRRGEGRDAWSKEQRDSGACS